MATGGDYVGLQLLGPDEGIELGGVVDRPLREQRLADTSPCFVAEPTGALRRYERTKKVVRVLVRAIYLFPALLLVKIALWIAAHAGAEKLGTVGDYLTVAFVVLVVVFFFFLGLLVLQHLWVGPRSKRASQTVPRFALPEVGDLESSRLLTWSPGARDLSGLADPAVSPRDTIRVRGQLLAIDGSATGTRLLGETWLETERGAVRLVQARPFAVVAEGQLPVVVRIELSPWLLLGPAGEARTPIRVGDDRRAAFEERVRREGVSLLELAGGRSRELTVGQEVELVGVVAERWPSIEGASLAGEPVRLAGAAGQAPYRGRGGPALLVVSSAYEPVLLAARA